MKLEIGAMCPKPSQQLKGLGLKRRDLTRFDKLADSLLWCYLHNLITEPEFTRAGRRLIAKIQAAVTIARAPHFTCTTPAGLTNSTK